MSHAISTTPRHGPVAANREQHCELVPAHAADHRQSTDRGPQAASDLAKNPVKVGDNWVVFGLSKRKDADMAEFAKKRDEVRQRMLSQRQGQVFEDYIAGVQRRMKSEGSIKIYDDVLNSIEEAEEPSAAPGLPPGLNFPSK